MRFVVFFFIPLLFISTQAMASPVLDLAQGQCISSNQQYQIDFRLDNGEFTITSQDDNDSTDHSVDIRQTGQGTNICVLTIQDHGQYIFSAILTTNAPNEFRAPILNQKFIEAIDAQILSCGETVVSLSLIEEHCSEAFLIKYAAHHSQSTVTETTSKTSQPK